MIANKIPVHKIVMDVKPYYREVITDGTYAKPVLITMWRGILRSRYIRCSHNSSNNHHHPTAVVAAAHDNIMSLFNTNAFDVLTIKTLDITNSCQSSISLEIREFLDLQEELDDLHNGLACRHFEPADPMWWANNVRKILRIIFRLRNRLHTSVDKNAIKAVVTSGLRNDERSILGQPIRELPNPNQALSPKLKLPGITAYSAASAAAAAFKRSQSLPKLLPSRDYNYSADDNDSVQSKNSRRSKSGHAKL